MSSDLTELRGGGAVLPLANCRYAMESVGESNGISITNHPDGWVEISYLFNGDAMWETPIVLENSQEKQ